MNRTSNCSDLDVYAGNKVRIFAEARLPAGQAGSVSPSTAKVAVTDINGVTVALTETITYNVAQTAMFIESFWTIADDARGGMYTVTIDIAGNVAAATERTIKVKARTLAVVPA